MHKSWPAWTASILFTVFPKKEEEIGCAELRLIHPRDASEGNGGSARPALHTGFSRRRNLCPKLPSTFIIVYAGKPVIDSSPARCDRSFDPFAVKRTAKYPLRDLFRFARAPFRVLIQRDTSYLTGAALARYFY